MNIKHELSIAIPDELFSKFRDADFIHIAACLNLEPDRAKRRTALNRYIQIVIDESLKIDKPHSLGRAIAAANKFLLITYKYLEHKENQL